MKKKYLSLVVLSCLVVLLSGCSLGQKSGSSTQKDKGAKKADQEKSYSGSLEKMMSLGMPLKCSWKKDDTYYGSSWVKGKRWYSEIHMEDKNTKVIFKDNCMWSWQEGNPQGLKMCFDEKEMAQEGKSMPSIQDMRPPEDLNYSCRPAALTEAKFNPPASVQFMDLEAMMQGAGE